MARKYEPNGKGKYDCPYCEFQSGTPQGIGRHVHDMHKDGANGVQAAADCAGQRATNPDRIEQTMTTNPVTIYPPMTAETQRVRRVCNAAVSMLTNARYRELPPALKMDVLAVLRMRLMEETGAAEAAMGGDMLGQSLDPLDTPRLPA